MGINSLTNPANPLSPLNPLNPLSPISLHESDKEEKKLKKKNEEIKKIKEEIKYELSANGFKYLKLATKEFDVFKEKIDKLGLPNKEKILDKVKEYFYSADNTKNKYYAIKGLNRLLDELGTLSREEIINKIKDTKYWSDAQENIAVVGGVAAVITTITLIITIVSGVEIAFIGTLFGFAIMISTKVLYSQIKDRNYDINTLFDSINDIYPDITREEFEKIIKLVDNEEFNVNEFKKILDKYYEDEKITKQEHKQIQEYLDNLLK